MCISNNPRSLNRRPFSSIIPNRQTVSGYQVKEPPYAHCKHKIILFLRISFKNCAFRTQLALTACSEYKIRARFYHKQVEIKLIN